MCPPGKASSTLAPSHREAWCLPSSVDLKHIQGPGPCCSDLVTDDFEVFVKCPLDSERSSVVPAVLHWAVSLG